MKDSNQRESEKPNLPRYFRGQWVPICLLIWIFSFAGPIPTIGQQIQELPDDAATPVPGFFLLQNVEELVDRAKESVVIIRHEGRQSREGGVGTGFVIDADGLIATNLHVAGEGRPITVESSDGQTWQVTEIHASDRDLDLAILRVNASNLIPMPLATASALEVAQPVLAIGNPQGLEHSVVAGLVSGHRQIGSLSMIQLAIPVEAGNSGGPVVDLEGRVQGILTMKSAVTENLGFAIPVNALESLLEKPNPILISRWLTIGALDTRRWKPLFGASWRQRAGRIRSSEPGDGFGGRALCLSTREVPEMPYEIAVTVRLDDESGAAGLAFLADGGDRHYAFYPSAGRLRLTRFDGPDVFSWTILREEPSHHYRSGEWNVLKVRVSPKKIICFVNGEVIFEAEAATFKSGAAGLAKFRNTEAEFKNFMVASEIPDAGHSLDELASILNSVDEAALSAGGGFPESLLSRLSSTPRLAAESLLHESDRLRRRADRLQKLSSAVHQRTVATRLVDVLGQPEPNLIRAALLVSQLDNAELDIEVYMERLEQMAEEAASKLPLDANDDQKLDVLKHYLFRENGYHGSRTEYYSRSNSYLNEVIDDREGIPITVSLLFMELGRRLGLDLEGIPLPGHFMVGYTDDNGELSLIDVFDSGRRYGKGEAELFILRNYGVKPADEAFRPTTSRDIAVRILRNLLGIAQAEGEVERQIRYLDTLVAIEPDVVEYRGMRVTLRYRLGRRREILPDLNWLLEHPAPGVDMEEVRRMRDNITNELPE